MEVSVGDVVCLKSGSPDLQVVGISTANRVEVQWFNGPVVQNADFAIECLIKKV